MKSYIKKNLILILILGLITLSPFIWNYVKNNHKVYLWMYFQTPYGYFDNLYYYKISAPIRGFYNAYYLNSFKIKDPRVCKFTEDKEHRFYVFSDSITNRCIDNPIMFTKRSDVFEIATSYNEKTRCELLNWRKMANGPTSLWDEFNSNYSLEQIYKNDAVEVYKFLIIPNGFICILQQDPIYKIYDDIVEVIGYEEYFKPYVLPYFSYKNFLEYDNLVQKRIMNEEI